MKVFLDSNFLIYLNAMTSGERRKFDELFVRLIKDQVFINILVVNEVLYVSRKYGLSYEATLKFLRSIVLPYVEVVSIGEGDLNLVEKYLLKYRLKPSDAMHLATIEKTGANYIVSEDEDFDKVEEVKRIWINTNF
ncbi:MAG: type II toxin-antitoxin system VapC family toxin [Candidatus Bathyarchaeia archaeon]